MKKKNSKKSKVAKDNADANSNVDTVGVIAWKLASSSDASEYGAIF